MSDSELQLKPLTGVAPEASGQIFGLFSKPAPAGWRYAAGARKAEPLDDEKLARLNERARWALQAQNSLLSAGSEKDARLLAMATAIESLSARFASLAAVGAPAGQAPAHPAALLFSRADATARPAALYELLDIANAQTDARLSALDAALEELRARLPVSAADSRDPDGARDGIANLQARLDHIVAELGEMSLANKRRLRQLTTEVLALHNARSVEAAQETVSLETLRTEVKRLQLTTEKLSDSLDLVSHAVEPRATLISSMAASLEKSNITPALTQWGPIFVRANDLIGATLLKTGEWDSHLLPAIDAAARSGGVAVDAGAHFGIVSSILATRFREVHAFEANSETFKILSLNAFLRGNILTHNLALSDRDGVQSLSVAEEQDLGAQGRLGALEHPNVGSLSFSRRGEAALPVSGAPLDALKLNDVRFIKVDCQGADALVLLGARETLQRCRPHIVFEWEAELARNYGVEFDALTGFLNELGYEITLLYTHNQKQTDFLARPREPAA